MKGTEKVDIHDKISDIKQALKRLRQDVKAETGKSPHRQTYTAPGNQSDISYSYDQGHPDELRRSHSFEKFDDPSIGTKGAPEYKSGKYGTHTYGGGGRQPELDKVAERSIEYSVAGTNTNRNGSERGGTTLTAEKSSESPDKYGMRGAATYDVDTSNLRSSASLSPQGMYKSRSNSERRFYTSDQWRNPVYNESLNQSEVSPSKIGGGAADRYGGAGWNRRSSSFDKGSFDAGKTGGATKESAVANADTYWDKTSPRFQGAFSSFSKEGGGELVDDGKSRTVDQPSSAATDSTFKYQRPAFKSEYLRQSSPSYKVGGGSRTLEENPGNYTMDSSIDKHKLGTSFEQNRNDSRIHDQSDIQILLDIERNKNMQLEKRITEKDKLLREATDLQNDLSRSLEESRRELIALKNEKGIDQMRDDEAHRRMEDMRNRIRELEQRQGAMLSESEDLRRKLQRDEDHIRILEQEKGTLKAEVRDLSSTKCRDDEFTTVLEKKHAHLQAEVNDLKVATRQLEEENQNLRKNKSQIYEESDRLQRRIADLESTNYRLQKERDGAQDELDLVSRDLNSKEKEFTDALADKCKRLEHAEADLSDTAHRLRKAENQLVNSDPNKVIIGLKREVDQLTEERDNLSLELRSRPSLRRVKECEGRIQELEAMLDENGQMEDGGKSYESSPQRSKSVGRGRTLKPSSRDNMKRDKELYRLRDYEKPSANTLQLLLQDILNELALESYKEIMPKLRSQNASFKGVEGARKFVSRVVDLVEKCSPDESLQKKPISLKHAWRWIKSIVEEYPTLKKTTESIDENRGILNRVVAILKAYDKTEVLERAEDLVIENEKLYHVIRKVKHLYRLDPEISLTELGVVLDGKERVNESSFTRGYK